MFLPNLSAFAADRSAQPDGNAGVSENGEAKEDRRQCNARPPPGGKMFLGGIQPVPVGNRFLFPAAFCLAYVKVLININDLGPSDVE